MTTNWYTGQIKFQCQGSGQCCLSRGQYGYVYLTKKDRETMAKELGISNMSFTKKYCEKTDGFFHLKNKKKSIECSFLAGKKCKVYKARPTQCRTWPFWPENMNAKSWQEEVVQFCPGVNKGKTWTDKEIKIQLDAQLKSEKEIFC